MKHKLWSWIRLALGTMTITLTMYNSVPTLAAPIPAHNLAVTVTNSIQIAGVIRDESTVQVAGVIWGS